MPSQSSPSLPGPAAPAGGESDGLSLRLVLRVRCAAACRCCAPVRADLVRFALAVAALGLIGTAPGALLLDLHWTRVLQGEPLTPFEARLLGLDPALSVHVDALDAATRRSVRDRELVLGVGLVLAARAARRRPRLLPALDPAAHQPGAAARAVPAPADASRCASTRTAGSATPSIASTRTARWSRI